MYVDSLDQTNGDIVLGLTRTGDNVLVDESGVIKLADFGCAKMKQFMSENFFTLLGTGYTKILRNSKFSIFYGA